MANRSSLSSVFWGEMFSFSQMVLPKLQCRNFHNFCLSSSCEQSPIPTTCHSACWQSVNRYRGNASQKISDLVAWTVIYWTTGNAEMAEYPFPIAKFSYKLGVTLVVRQKMNASERTVDFSPRFCQQFSQFPKLRS